MWRTDRQTNRQTDRRRDWTILIAACSQVKQRHKTQGWGCVLRKLAGQWHLPLITHHVDTVSFLGLLMLLSVSSGCSGLFCNYLNHRISWIVWVKVQKPTETLMTSQGPKQGSQATEGYHLYLPLRTSDGRIYLTNYCMKDIKVVWYPWNNQMQTILEGHIRKIPLKMLSWIRPVLLHLGVGKDLDGATFHPNLLIKIHTTFGTLKH